MTITRIAARLAAGLALALTAFASSAPSASAGGWAVTTLDELPAPKPGEPVDVGFTIRQHGVVPVALDEGVAIEVESSDGTVTMFPAVASGDVGHYVATVVFPTATQYKWTVHQGWFGPQALGGMTVAEPSSAPSPGYRFPAWLRYGLPALALALGAIAVADAAAGIRRRRILAA
jgi:hypothetical protein